MVSAVAIRDPKLLPERPMPIGALPLPFGYLLIEPGSAEVEAVRAGLLAGLLPSKWPTTLRGHELALGGDPVGALAAMSGDGVVARFNRFVIDPDGADVSALRADLGTELGVLVDIVLFGLGRLEEPPAAEDCTGEIAALALAARAAAELDGGQFDVAASTLEAAIDAAAPAFPALAGVLYGAAAQGCRAAGDVPAATAALQAGIALLTDTDVTIGCAELHMELATLLHEQAGERRDLLNTAISHYHSALQLISAQTAPQLYAGAHANLASAYLTMPMVEASDQLRLGVAVGSLRAALTVYTQDTYPGEWSSAQLNLANALVYAPSTHQADNLVEAVELYEAVLVARDRHVDPLGYARVLANQGNALAHLGMFEHARGKLVEARFLFEEFHEYEAVTSVRGLLDEIARTTTMAGHQT
jgi:tetratricopeptide (TPR) repeat protein